MPCNTIIPQSDPATLNHTAPQLLSACCQALTLLEADDANPLALTPYNRETIKERDRILLLLHGVIAGATGDPLADTPDDHPPICLFGDCRKLRINSGYCREHHVEIIGDLP